MEIASLDGVAEPMEFELWRPWAGLVFLEPNGWEYALFTLELLVSLGILYRFRRSFADLDRRGLLLLANCLVTSLVVPHLALVSFSHHSLLPPPDVPFIPGMPSAALVGAVPITVAGAWLGAGPGLLVGLVSGVARAGITTGSITDPFHLAVLGFLVGIFLHQDYRGRLPFLARQPLVALPLMIPFAALSLLLSSCAATTGSGLSGLDYAMARTGAHLGSLLLEALGAAFIVQAVYSLFPRARPVQTARRIPPYGRTLNRRLLFLFVPLVGFTTVVLVYAITAVALRFAISDAVEHMAMDANRAADETLHSIQTSRSLLAEFSHDTDLWRADRAVLEARLRIGVQTVTFFDQLLLLGASGRHLAAYPSAPRGDPRLTSQERALLNRGLQSGATQVSSVHRSDEGLVIQSFLTPVTRPTTAGGDDDLSRVLLGRIRFDVNPVIGRMVAGLQQPHAQGEGFVVDSEGKIVAHPDPNMLLAEYRRDEGNAPIAAAFDGWAYESRNLWDNRRELVFRLPVQGYSWVVVVLVPYAVVLEQARQIAAPLLGLQILLSGGLMMAIFLATNWLTQPLHRLARAADRIAEGDLSSPVEIPGEDEVARVGGALEEIRVRLQDRVDDLSLLLEISQSVSATLELSKGMPLILDGVLRATGAQVARVVLLSPEGGPGVTMSRGDPRHGLRVLDNALVVGVKNLERPLIVENLARARLLVSPEPLPRAIRAVVALPIRTEEEVSAVMWVGYGAVRQFEDAHIDLLSTLAGQAAVLVESARLFQTAEGERRRLAATLTSTTDAVLVTDRENRVLLINPAAERAFGLKAEQISDRRIDRSPLPQALVDIFGEPLAPGEALTRELSLSDGATLYASVSAILSADGQRLGRVAVMRDITHLKELDELKSEFVATVSHDLRGPLAYMRGFATMLSTAGELNQQQREYLERILQGVSRMSDLVEDLLDLGGIEAGVGLERQPCHLGVVVSQAVDSMRAQAAAKGITLQVDLMSRSTRDSGQDAIVSGDPALLRQAITNLVDNAVKYTPGGGTVSVGLSVRTDDGRKRAVICVSDTGIGIAPEDQVRLFEKFYRVNRRDVPEVPGTGLGLAIVKSIVERHGGEVSVESELNEGSTFCVTLPLTGSTAVD